MTTLMQNISKINVAVIGAALVTASLFFFMQFVIQSNLEEPTRLPHRLIAPIVIPHNEIIIPKKERMPDPVEEIEIVPRERVVEFDSGEAIYSGPVIASPVIITENFENNVPVQNEALALVKVSPQYPSRALSKGIEGFVVVEFNVGPQGSVINPRVLVSEPNGVFDRAALRAIERWKYTPKVVDGEGVVMYGIRQKLSFNIDG